MSAYLIKRVENQYPNSLNFVSIIISDYLFSALVLGRIIRCPNLTKGVCKRYFRIVLFTKLLVLERRIYRSTNNQVVADSRVSHWGPMRKNKISYKAMQMCSRNYETLLKDITFLSHIDHVKVVVLNSVIIYQQSHTMKYLLV